MEKTAVTTLYGGPMDGHEIPALEYKPGHHICLMNHARTEVHHYVFSASQQKFVHCCTRHRTEEGHQTKSPHYRKICRAIGYAEIASISVFLYIVLHALGFIH